MLNYLVELACAMLSILIIFAMICHVVLKTLKRKMRLGEVIISFSFATLLFVVVECGTDNSNDVLIGIEPAIIWLIYLVGLIIFSKYNK